MKYKQGSLWLSKFPPYKFLLNKVVHEFKLLHLTLRAKLMKIFRYTTVPLTVISGAPEGLWPLLYPGPLSAALPLWPCWSVHNKCWPQLHPENLPTGGLRFQLHSDCSPLCKDQAWKLSTGSYWVIKNYSKQMYRDYTFLRTIILNFTLFSLCICLTINSKYANIIFLNFSKNLLAVSGVPSGEVGQC